MKQRILFIDRDGTILREPADEQIDSFEKFSFVPGAISALRFLRQHTDFLFVMVSNQDGLGTESYPEEDFWPTQNLMLDILKGEGFAFDAIHIDRSLPKDNLPTRKPGTGMLTAYMTEDYDLAGSFVIGDRKTDAKLAENLGCKSFILSDDLTWEKIAELLFAGERNATQLASDRTRPTGQSRQTTAFLGPGHPASALRHFEPRCQAAGARGPGRQQCISVYRIGTAAAEPWRGHPPVSRRPG